MFIHRAGSVIISSFLSAIFFALHSVLVGVGNLVFFESFLKPLFVGW